MNSSTLASEKLGKAISHEQFDRVIEAILDGKYSWACVLLLSSAGYNPLHYIPYRTYNRLSKDNSAKRDSSGKSVGNVKANSKPGEIGPDRRTSEQHSNKIKDLNYLEAVKEPCKQLRGGTKDSWFVEQFQGYFASRGNTEQTQEIYRAL